MNPSVERDPTFPTMAQLKPRLAPYQKSNPRTSYWQIANTLIPYILLWPVMALALRTSFWLMLPVAVLTAGFMIRLFIIFHDCGHNSFLPTTEANRKLGFWVGVLVFTPAEQWWKSHAIHHATSGNLDKRGHGDVTTWTLEEFYDKTWFQRTGYRFFRNPLVMFGLGPIFMFGIMHRLVRPRYGKKETNSVIYTNLALAVMAVGMSLLFGWKSYLIMQVTMLWLGGVTGIFLFYLQHQFEEGYWEHNQDWDYVASALLGASFYRLPRLLQWFSGSIGYHHIHHLSPRIPNYYLQPAHENSPEIQRWTRVIEFGEGWRTVRYKLWNEGVKRMVGFPAEPVSATAPAGTAEREKAGD